MEEQESVKQFSLIQCYQLVGDFKNSRRLEKAPAMEYWNGTIL